MRRLLTLCAAATVFTALALAETWTGKLIDANCSPQQNNATTCDPTSSTTAFALLTGGKAYKLDDAGNTKAIEALKSRADRSANPNSPASAGVTAKVTGTQDSDGNLKVETIAVQ